MSCVRSAAVLRRYIARDPTCTALYQLVAEQRRTFERVVEGGVPRFVLDGFGAFLRCGVLAFGFARFGCTRCKHEHFVALSCKTRGLCPSCGGRRMMVLTRYLTDFVLPHVPVRQWVLSLPYPLRYKLAYDHELCTAVHRALSRALRSHLRRQARSRGLSGVDTGAVTFVQRYGGGLNLNVHFHLLGLDGWYRRERDGELVFDKAPAPSQREVEAVLLDVHARVMRLLERRGLLEAGVDDRLAQDAAALAACYEGAVTQRLGLGPERGRPVVKLRSSLAAHLALAADRVERGGLLCAQLDGFDLHARVAVGAGQRERLEDLVRYCARPPLANERLTKQADGRYLLRLKSRWRDGTTHLCLDPLEAMERLAAQIPKPRINLVLYSGVLAPNAKLRREVVAQASAARSSSADDGSSQTRAERESWAELMRVTFGLDVLGCPECGGRLKHIATILDARVARKILEHVGLPARAPPERPPKSPPPFWPHVDE